MRPRDPDEPGRTASPLGAVPRPGLVAQWLRASRSVDNPLTPRIYAAGITILQVLWLCLLVLPEPAAQIAWWR